MWRRKSHKVCFYKPDFFYQPTITVFNSPDQVTAKLIQSCYDEQIQQYIYFKLNPMRKSDMGLYLREAMRLYQLTTKLSEALSKVRLLVTIVQLTNLLT